MPGNGMITGGSCWVAFDVNGKSWVEHDNKGNANKTVTFTFPEECKPKGGRKNQIQVTLKRGMSILIDWN